MSCRRLRSSRKWTLLCRTTPSEFERGTQWLVGLLPPRIIHAPPDSDEEHILVADDDGNLFGVIVQSKRARLAAEAAEK